MTAFNPPVFTQPDAKEAEIELQQEYTNITGKTLFPAQPETLLSNWAAYLKTVVETEIQYTGEQCLVNYAIEQNLDQLGAFWEVPRLPAEPSITTLEFNLIAAVGFDYLVPSGTRVRTDDRAYVFETTAQLIIPQGETKGEVLAQSTTTGDDANGYAIGTINELFDILSGIDTVSNTTVSSSGAGIETDDRYRERLKLAPNSVTVAGTSDQYKFLTFTADSSIIDVGIETPDSGTRVRLANEESVRLAQEIIDYLEAKFIDLKGTTAEEIAPLTIEYIRLPRYVVDIYILTDDGGASQDVIDKVQAFFDAGDVRPLTDTVRVFAPITTNVDIEVEVTALNTADTSTLLESLQAELDSYVNDVETQLGYDIVPSQISDRLFSDQVYDIKVVSPEEVVTIDFNQRPIVTTSTVTITGIRER